MKCNVSDKLYIDRTAAIMTAMNYDGNGTAQDASQDIAAALGCIPASDVAPVRRGRWIVERDDYFGFRSVEIKCSECNSSPKGDKMTPFCPNCGADMREVKKDGRAQ